MTGTHRRAAIALLAALAVAAGAGCHDVRFEPAGEEGEIQVYDNLFSVDVIDDENAVAVGYFGAIYVTHDGGDTWRKRDGGTQRSLYEVSMGDARHGWAVGQLGTILRTEDGGDTWERQPNVKEEENSHLFSVHAVDGETAWAVGVWGTRLYTEDGGRTWQDRSLVITPEHPQFVWLVPQEQKKVREGGKVYEDVGLNDVHCLPDDPQRCWIAGEFGYIFRSENGGRTWERGGIKGDIQIAPIEFGYNEARAKRDLDELLEPVIEKVADQQHLKVEIEPFATEREIREIAREGDIFDFFDLLEVRIAAVRGVLEEGGLLADRMRVVGAPPWDYEDFVEYDPEFLDRYLEGRKAEQGKVRVRIAQNPYLFRVRFSDAQNGLISSLGGLVLRTTDGGRTWDGIRASDVKQALFAMSMRGERALTAGEKGLVRVSADGGETWRRPSRERFPPIFTFMRDMELGPNGELGLIVGQEGLVLRSTDRGVTWEKVLGREAA